MVRADALAGSILSIFALYYIYESLQLPFWSDVGPGAGALPLLCGLLFAALSLALVVGNLREGSPDAGRVDLACWRTAAAVLGALFLAVALARALGMILTIFLFMLFHTLVVERVRWKSAVLASLAITAMFYLVFEMWLDVPLVIGMLGI